MAELVAVDMVDSAGRVTQCTLGKVHGGQRGAGNPKRECDVQRIQGAEVEAWSVAWVACTRVGENEDADVGQTEGVQEDTWKKMRVRYGMVKS